MCSCVVFVVGVVSPKPKQTVNKRAAFCEEGREGGGEEEETCWNKLTCYEFLPSNDLDTYYQRNKMTLH